MPVTVHPCLVVVWGIGLASTTPARAAPTSKVLNECILCESESVSLGERLGVRGWAAIESAMQLKRVNVLKREEAALPESWGGV